MERSFMTIFALAFIMDSNAQFYGFGNGFFASAFPQTQFNNFGQFPPPPPGFGFGPQFPQQQNNNFNNQQQQPQVTFSQQPGVQTIQSSFPGGGTATVNNFGGATSTIQNFGPSSQSGQSQVDLSNRFGEDEDQQKPPSRPVTVNNVKPGQTIVENNYGLSGQSTVNNFQSGGTHIQNNLKKNSKPEAEISNRFSDEKAANEGTKVVKPNGVVIENTEGKKGQVSSYYFPSGGVSIQNN